MAKASVPHIPASVTPQKGIELLNRQIQRGEELLRVRPLQKIDHTGWLHATKEFLTKAFGSPSPSLQAVVSTHGDMNLLSRRDDSFVASSLQRQIRMLQTCIEQLETEIELSSVPPQHAHSSPEAGQSQDKKKVFVVHGRNNPARIAMFSFLRSLGLEPIEWAQAVQLTGKASPYIGEILDAAFKVAQAVVVLMTPDDIAYLDQQFQAIDDQDYEKTPTPQARPNVLFEAGMAMGRASDRTILVQLGTLRPFSDIGGRHVLRLSGSSQSRQDLADRLATAGCDVNLSGRDWHSTGDFDSCILSTAKSVTKVSPESGAAKDAFEKLKLKMFDLFDEMKCDIEEDESQVVREFVVLPSDGVVFNHGKPRFEYYEDRIPWLQNKIDLLEVHGFVIDVTPADYPIYRMTEELIEFLATLQP